MNAQELRLGNLVFKHFEDKAGELEVVTSRTIFDCLVNPTGKFSYSGIPLSPEILGKAGKRVSVMGGSSDFYWNIGGFIYEEKDLVQMSGLHWLQNVHYFKTGEELTINF